MIYFIQAERSKSIKIGYTGNDPARRLAALQTGSAEPLFLLGSVDGGIEAEKALHARFAAHRLRPDGEWFAPADDLKAAISEMLRPEPEFPVLFGRTIESVYLAGKITGTEWRDAISPRWYETNADPRHWAEQQIACPVPGRRPLKLFGPFWSEDGCEHGGSASSAGFPHASTNRDIDCFGRVSSSSSSWSHYKAIALAVKHSIHCSDLIFAWIDSLDCFGTLFEIGYARSLGKVVVVYRASDFDAAELWLTLANAHHSDAADTPGNAWDDLFTPGVYESPNAATGS